MEAELKRTEADDCNQEDEIGSYALKAELGADRSHDWKPRGVCEVPCLEEFAIGEYVHLLCTYAELYKDIYRTK
jgi:hypothetical protein